VITQANLEILLDEGALDLAQRGDAFIRSATWTAVAATQRYVLSGASPKVTGFLDVYWPAGGLIYTPTSGNTKTHPSDFQFVSESWLDTQFPGWQDDDDGDTLLHAFVGFNSSGYLVLGVRPPSKSTTPSFKLYYKSRGTNMAGTDGAFPWTGDTNNLTHTEPWQKAIAHYAIWKIHDELTHKAGLADKNQIMYLAEAEELKASQEKIWQAEADGLRRDGEMATLDTFGAI